MKWALLALALSGCTGVMELTYACFDGMNQVCDLKKCSDLEFQHFTQECKKQNGTNKPGLWTESTPAPSPSPKPEETIRWLIPGR